MFVIKQDITNHYLLTKGIETSSGEIIKCYYPDLEKAKKFDTIEEALEIFKEIIDEPKRSYNYRIIDTEYEN